MNAGKTAERIFRAAVNAVHPSALIPSQVAVRDNILVAGNNLFPLDLVNDVYVIGAGKASAFMGAELEQILGDRIRGGQIITKYGYSCRLKHIKVTEAGHPVPDNNGFSATKDILKIASRAGVQDLVICLLSGGGSALLADYPDGCSEKDVIQLNDLLVNCGAGISEINAIRKHLSKIKGGQLARAVNPATLVTLILSDVPGDPLDVIASGPTVPDPTTFSDALEVVGRYDLWGKLPASMLRYLREGKEGLVPDTPKPSDTIFVKTHNILIGTNRIALEAAALEARENNINALIADTSLQGDADSVAEYLTMSAIRLKSDENEVKPVCLLYGGETTVKMTGKGRGGRNQHLALKAAMLLEGHPGITFLAGGTDGSDGPTNAAGAVVDGNTCPAARLAGLDPEKFLSEFDSYDFFRKAGGHVITGPTMTNVMDVIVIIIG